MLTDVAAQVGSIAFEAVLATFYWFHCVEPALRMAGARQRTFRVVQIVGLAALAGFSMIIAFRLADEPRPGWLMPVDALFFVWFGAAWPIASVVARFSGGVDELEALRLLLWRTNGA